MNKVVREHYPVEKLPDDLREGFPAGAKVTVTLEDDAMSADLFKQQVDEILRNPKPMTLTEARALVGERGTTAEEAVQRIRSLRDEWDA
ncbi:hypothetical protein [Aquabacter cavernae]|uniref:hypothetical protein n=1 Tax=Aquabacter cavernae TaxID=2496029 RepID=UPI000F8DFA1A|nr:hypothetical protein [Aquabacter cavernae]